jgi:ABC-type Zn uptake system ZnuABC Zn-binding protein ZnuA
MATLALGAAAARAAEPLRVVATIEPLCMLAREVGGARVACTTLVPPGASPHAFEPRPSALAAVAQAQLLLRAGNGIDDWAEPLGNAGDRAWSVIGPGCAQNDPACAHFWIEPLAAASAAGRIRRELAFRDAPGAAAYAKNTERFRVAALAEVAGLPERFGAARGAALVSFHPAWGDFLRRCGLVELGAIQRHGAEEPTPRRLAELIRAARAARVRAVLVEPQLDPHTARILAEEIGAEIVTVDPLGDPRAPERASYDALLEWNTRALLAALVKETP